MRSGLWAWSLMTPPICLHTWNSIASSMRILINRLTRGVASACAKTSTDPVNQRWRIVSAVCVQRFPRLTRLQIPLEKRYQELQLSIRLRRSRLSDFELEEKDYLDKKLAREKKASEEDLDAAEVARMEKEAIFEEVQESRNIELQSFKPQHRDSINNEDLQSINRKLDEMLYLLVKKPREEHSWQFPQGGADAGEPLVKAAARELMEECGTELNVQFLSNSPVAYHSYTHDKLKGSQLIGAKVFFLKAQYVSGSIKLNPTELEHFVWVTKDEMKDYVSSDYYSAIAPALLP